MTEPWTEEREAAAMARCEQYATDLRESCNARLTSYERDQSRVRVESFRGFAEGILPDAITELQRLRGELIDLKAEFAADHADLVALRAMIARSGFDLSPCMECGQAVLCIPDGTPMCEPCARKGEHQP